MKYLVVYAHPNNKSFCHDILDTIKNTISNLGKELVISDLYAMNFNPVLSTSDFEKMASGVYADDVKTEMEKITNANVIIFVNPIWWTGYPAIVKGYIDRVFSAGFAFEVTSEGVIGKMQSKIFILINTCGSSEAEYQNSGMFNSLLMTMVKGVFEFCGSPTNVHKMLYTNTSINDQKRKEILEDVKKFISNLVLQEGVSPFY